MKSDTLISSPAHFSLHKTMSWCLSETHARKVRGREYHGMRELGTAFLMGRKRSCAAKQPAGQAVGLTVTVRRNFGSVPELLPPAIS